MFILSCIMSQCRIYFLCLTVFLSCVAWTSSGLANVEPNLSQDEDKISQTRFEDASVRGFPNFEDEKIYKGETKREKCLQKSFDRLHQRRKRSDKEIEAVDEEIDNSEEADDGLLKSFYSDVAGGEEVLQVAVENKTESSGLLNGIQHFFHLLKPKESVNNETTTAKVDESLASTPNTSQDVTENKPKEKTLQSQNSPISVEPQKYRVSSRNKMQKNDRRATFDFEIKAVPIIVNYKKKNVFTY